VFDAFLLPPELAPTEATATTEAAPPPTGDEE
jgi:hypothetical protein